VGIRTSSSHIKIVKNRSSAVSGLSSLTEFHPIVMPGNYYRADLKSIFSEPEIACIRTAVHEGKLPKDFWGGDDAEIQYADTKRRVSMKTLSFSDWDRGKFNTMADSPLLFMEFQTAEYDSEDLHAKRNPGETQRYFDLLRESYETVKNGDVEIVEIPEMTKETVFVASSKVHGHDYWFLMPHPEYIDYLHHKFPTRKLKFVANTRELESDLLRHGTGLLQGRKENMDVTVGVLDARSQELLAITRLNLLSTSNDKHNQVNRRMIESFRRDITCYADRKAAEQS
jgi:hypothetical protein